MLVACSEGCNRVIAIKPSRIIINKKIKMQCFVYFAPLIADYIIHY